MSEESIIKADIKIHFRTGATLDLPLHETIFFSSKKELKDALRDPEFMKSFGEREMSFINLEEVVFINVQHIRVLFNHIEGEKK